MLEIIGAPVNRPIVSRYLGLPDLVDPADDNRSKQFMEIEGLMLSQPIPTTNGSLAPSIPVDVEIDDHSVHIQTIKDWAVSSKGMQAKAASPAGYENVLLHLMAHKRALQQLTTVPEATAA